MSEQVVVYKLEDVPEEPQKQETTLGSVAHILMGISIAPFGLAGFMLFFIIVVMIGTPEGQYVAGDVPAQKALIGGALKLGFLLVGSGALLWIIDKIRHKA